MRSRRKLTDGLQALHLGAPAERITSRSHHGCWIVGLPPLRKLSLVRSHDYSGGHGRGSAMHKAQHIDLTAADAPSLLCGLARHLHTADRRGRGRPFAGIQPMAPAHLKSQDSIS